MNQSWFLQKGVLFPETGHSAGYGHVLLFEDKSLALFADLNAELATHEARGIQSAILSWEGIAQMGELKLEKIAEQLQAHQLIIVGYIREQSEIVQSGYFQAAKQRPQKRVVGDYLRSEKLLTPKHIDYDWSLEKFSRVFGRESMRIRVYEREQLAGEDIVIDFLDILGIESDQSFVKSSDEQNISLDPGSVYLLNIIDGYFDDPEGREKLVDALLNDIQCNGRRGKYFLEKSQVDFIKSHYQPGNEQVARKYLGRDSGTLFSYSRPTFASDQPRHREYCDAKIAGLHALVDFRPWTGQELLGMDLQRIASPAAGWSLAEPWGLWSDQAESIIRFRLLRSRIDPFARRLRINIRGRYFHDNTSTRVRAPGLAATDLNLEQACVEIPLQALEANACIELRLEHSNPVSPASLALGKDVRTLAFALTAISFTVGDE
jgi:hypothetical protein